MTNRVGRDGVASRRSSIVIRKCVMPVHTTNASLERRTFLSPRSAFLSFYEISLPTLITRVSDASLVPPFFS